MYVEPETETNFLILKRGNRTYFKGLIKTYPEATARSCSVKRRS